MPSLTYDIEITKVPKVSYPTITTVKKPYTLFLLAENGQILATESSINLLTEFN
jgi:mitochondrial fission protein ELM1